MTPYQGVNLPDLAEGEVSLGAVVLSKVMLPNGDIAYREHCSPDLHAVEMLGMVDTFQDTLKMLLRGRTERLDG